MERCGSLWNGVSDDYYFISAPLTYTLTGLVVSVRWMNSSICMSVPKSHLPQVGSPTPP